MVCRNKRHMQTGRVEGLKCAVRMLSEAGRKIRWNRSGDKEVKEKGK